MEYVARHLAKRAPSPRYSSSRSRSPSRPSVIVSAPSRERERLRAHVHLDPGDDPAPGEQLREGRAVGRALPDRLVVEDHARDELLRALGREQQVPVGAPVLLGRLDADRVEALLDRPRALVRGQDPLALGHERLRGLVERLSARHRIASSVVSQRRLSPSGAGTTPCGRARRSTLERAANPLDRHGDLIRERPEHRRQDDTDERQDEPVLGHCLTVRTPDEQMETREGHPGSDRPRNPLAGCPVRVRPPGEGRASPRYHDPRADVAQLVEHWLPKPGVAGSSPVVRFGLTWPESRDKAGTPRLSAVGSVLRSRPLKSANRWRALARNWRAGRRMLDSYLARSSASLTNAATSASDGV